jgi:putative glycosyltransferase (TIGR04372 family)
MKKMIIRLVGFVSFKVAIILRRFNIIITPYSDMFAHQAWNIEYHIRRHIKKHNKFPKLIGVQSTSLIPNLGLYSHHKRYGIIVLPPKGFLSIFLKLGLTYQKKLHNGRDINLLGSSAFALTTMNNIFAEDSDILLNSSVAMPLINSEIKKANIFLKKYNLQQGNYMCFRDRDLSYIRKKSQSSIISNKKYKLFITREYNVNLGENIYDYARNIPVESYYKGIKELSKIGIKSVRYGASSGNRCDNKLVFDYSFLYRDDNYDITDLFLMENCKFYIGPPSGDEVLAMAFNKPICSINSFPWPYINIPYRADSMHVPQKLWIKKEKRFMKLSEMVGMEEKYSRREFVDTFDKMGIEPIKNNEEEIAGAIMEMNARLDGTWDKERDIFKKYLTKSNLSFSSKAILSTTFLEMNPDIL